MSRLNWHPEQFLARMKVAADKAATIGAAVAARHAETNMQRLGEPSKPGQFPRTDTGHLRRSIAYVSPAVTGRPGVAAFGTNVAYGRKLEFGGFVTATKGRMLTVPLNRDARLLRRRHKSLRSIKGLRVVKTPKGVFLLGTAAQADGTKRRYRALFKLVPRVYIAARPWAMRSALQAAPEMRRRMAQVLRAELRGAA